MSKASVILEALPVVETFQIIGDLNASDIVASFEEKLKTFGFENIEVEVFLDPEDGTFVKFTDDQFDSVLVLFEYDDNGDVSAAVVSEDDNQITIDLSPMDPPIIELDDGSIFVDLIDLSWMNKTTLQLLLNAGMVGSNLKKAMTVESRHVVIGNRKMKLPIVMIKDQMSGKDKMKLQKAKNHGLL